MKEEKIELIIDKAINKAFIEWHSDIPNQTGALLVDEIFEAGFRAAIEWSMQRPTDLTNDDADTNKDNL